MAAWQAPALDFVTLYLMCQIGIAKIGDVVLPTVGSFFVDLGAVIFTDRSCPLC